MIRLHWFSPLPPDRTDIGHFTNRVLPAFDGKAEMTVWTTTENPVPPDLPGVEIRPIEMNGAAIRELNRGDAIFYNLGNHGHFHSDILDAAWRVPGFVILHEADLQGLFAHYWLERRNDAPAFVAEMARLHGPAGEAFAVARSRGEDDGPAISPYPILAPALDNALAVICHTQEVEEAARALDVPVMRIELAYAASQPVRQFDRSGPIRLVQFGYLGPHRRTETVLRALSCQPDPSGFHFHVYGPVWDVGFIEDLVAELDLTGQVTLHGFVPDAELDAAIGAADMVFNLRFPTIGEASGSQLRIWNAAAPSLVSAIGWFADLPYDTVVKCDPSDDIRAAADVLSALRVDRTTYDALGVRGRERLERYHAPASYADELIAAAAERGALSRRAALYRISGRIGAAADAIFRPGSEPQASAQRRLATRLLESS